MNRQTTLSAVISPLRAACAAALVGAATLALAPAVAQTAPKDIAVEPGPVFGPFQRWVTTVFVVAMPDAPAPTQAVAFPPPAPQGQPYQPEPVIVGLPDLPLAGAGSAEAGRAWAAGLNYQGVHARLVVLDPRTGKRELKPLTYAPRVGERFRIRLVTSFDAVADLQQISGADWNTVRTGQAYPAAGSSVQLVAGRTLELPLAANEYFAFDGQPATERVLLSIRSAKALGKARSAQPAYRLDGANGSTYLQLVPKDQFPAVEQLISPRRG